MFQTWVGPEFETSLFYVYILPKQKSSLFLEINIYFNIKIIRFIISWDDLQLFFRFWGGPKGQLQILQIRRMNGVCYATSFNVLRSRSTLISFYLSPRNHLSWLCKGVIGHWGRGETTELLLRPTFRHTLWETFVRSSGVLIERNCER